MQQLRSSLLASCKQFGRRSNSTIAGTVYYRCGYHNPERKALVAPAENIDWTYGQLWEQITLLAGGLRKAGFQEGSVIASDLDRNSSSLLLQMAVAHNGMQLLTVKSKEDYNRLCGLVGVQASVPASKSSFLSGHSVAELQKLGGQAGEGATDRSSPLAYYNSADVTSNRQVYLHGIGIAGLLQIKPEEKVCVASSLNHSFGMGGVIGAVVRSAVVYLPDPEAPDTGDCSVLVADEIGIKALSANQKSALRCGLAKVGEYASHNHIPSATSVGTKVLELAASGQQPLFDACKDTYWPIDA